VGRRRPTEGRSPARGRCHERSTLTDDQRFTQRASPLRFCHGQVSCSGSPSCLAQRAPQRYRSA
jgi:hypothetical protein